jgi:uncharacterized surface protein with fasciclin (FAS1) repeats
MTYNGPYSQSMNFIHMFDIQDLKGPYPKKASYPNTLLNIIENHPDFKKFHFMVKTAQLEDIFNSEQADFTLFIPSDKFLELNDNENVFVNMDILTARNIVRTSMLNNRISSEILEDSPNSWYYTVNKSNRLCITNVRNETYINGNIKVIYKDIVATNGIIHVIDNIIIPYII